MSDNETSYSAYWSAVEATAVDVAQRVKDGEDFGDALHEEIDGSWWITHYHAARAVMQHTENDDALFDEMGADALSGCDTFGDVVTRCAYYAMFADVASRYEEPEEEEEDPEEEEGPRYDPQPGDTLTLVGDVWTVVSRAGGDLTVDVLRAGKTYRDTETVTWWASDGGEWARPA